MHQSWRDLSSSVLIRAVLDRLFCDDFRSLPLPSSFIRGDIMSHQTCSATSPFRTSLICVLCTRLFVLLLWPSGKVRTFITLCFYSAVMSCSWQPPLRNCQTRKVHAYSLYSTPRWCTPCLIKGGHRALRSYLAQGCNPKSPLFESTVSQ